MSVFTNSQDVFIIVGDVDLSDNFIDARLDDEYIGTGGIVGTTGVLRFGEVDGQILDDWLLDWLKIGTRIRIYYGDSLHPRGTLRLQSTDYNQQARILTMRVACILTARSFKSPTEQDKIIIDPLVGVSVPELVDQLLALAGLPYAHWGHYGEPIRFYVSPNLQDSYVRSVGALLASVGLFAWVLGDETIRVDAVHDSTLLHTWDYTDLIKWERVTIDQPPAAIARVGGGFNRVRPGLELDTRTSVSYGELSDLIPGGRAVGRAATDRLLVNESTLFADSRVVRAESADRLGYLVYRGLPGMPLSVLVSDRDSVLVQQYSPGPQAELLFETYTESAPLYKLAQSYCDWARTKGLPVALSTTLTACRRSVAYTYDDRYVLRRVVERVWEPVIKLIGEFGLVDWEVWAALYTISSEAMSTMVVTEYFEKTSGWEKVVQRWTTPTRSNDGQAGLIAQIEGYRAQWERTSREDLGGTIVEVWEENLEARTRVLGDTYRAAVAMSVSTVETFSSTSGQCNPPAIERFPARVGVNDGSVRVDVTFDGFATDWADLVREYNIPYLGDWFVGDTFRPSPEQIAYAYGLCWHQVALNLHRSINIELPHFQVYRPYGRVRLGDYLLALNGTSWSIQRNSVRVSSDCSYLGRMVGGALYPRFAPQLLSIVSFRFIVVGFLPEPVERIINSPISFTIVIDASFVLDDIISPISIRFLVESLFLYSPVSFAIVVNGDLLGYSPDIVGLSGSAGLTLLSATASDDTPFEISDIGFDFPYFGSTYRAIGVSPNLYLTFGFLSSVYSGFTLTNPGASLQLQASDRSIRFVYAGMVGRGYRIRFEGHTSTSLSPVANIFWEVTLFPDGAIMFVADYSAFTSVGRILATDGTGANWAEEISADVTLSWVLRPSGSTYTIQPGSYR